MTKKELIKAISDKTGCTANNVTGVLREYQQIILGELKKDGNARVPLLEMGAFKIIKRSARTGINPLTKQKIDIPAKEVPKFEASKKLKEFVSGEEKDIFSFNF
ncbi:HU family DNA-binding protein [Mycoplasma parvum]|uniref:Transcriptional regulator n=1 Tax=Mycoplasma parvum str. Indiana TaxID=1403316 RepID=U5NEV4_9MOLU|nr:HU family DNA-binding protein [Mycoplasma parvum]AGX88768.1 transcriptional regulator [Mycoplasma parvum str. Indiana]